MIERREVKIMQVSSLEEGVSNHLFTSPFHENLREEDFVERTHFDIVEGKEEAGLVVSPSPRVTVDGGRRGRLVPPSPSTVHGTQFV